MNRYQLLQEMGITPWILKKEELSEPESKVTHPAAPTNFPEASMQTDNLPPQWVLVTDSSAISSVLFSKIVTSIQKFGVKTICLPFEPTNWQAEQVKGDLLIAFGEQAAQFFSNEPSSVDELREIVFGTTNMAHDEIPVIVTHGISEIQKKPMLKKMVWNDLLYARSVFLETYS